MERVAYQSVQRLVSSLTGLQAIVNLVSPRTHLHRADELGLDDSLLVEAGQDGR